MSNTSPQLLIYSIHTQKNYQQAAKKWEESHSWARIVIVVVVIVSLSLSLSFGVM